MTRKFILVNKDYVAQGRADVISVNTERGTVYGDRVDIEGLSSVRFVRGGSPPLPWHIPAQVWIETEAPVTVWQAPLAPVTLSRTHNVGSDDGWVYRRVPVVDVCINCKRPGHTTCNAVRVGR